VRANVLGFFRPTKVTLTKPFAKLTRTSLRQNPVCGLYNTKSRPPKQPFGYRAEKKLDLGWYILEGGRSTQGIETEYRARQVDVEIEFQTESQTPKTMRNELRKISENSQCPEFVDQNKPIGRARIEKEPDFRPLLSMSFDRSPPKKERCRIELHHRE